MKKVLSKLKLILLTASLHSDIYYPTVIYWNPFARWLFILKKPACVRGLN